MSVLVLVWIIAAIVVLELLAGLVVAHWFRTAPWDPHEPPPPLENISMPLSADEIRSRVFILHTELVALRDNIALSRERVQRYTQLECYLLDELFELLPEDQPVRVSSTLVLTRLRGGTITEGIPY